MYLERFRLDGSVAFLTGAGRGIGRCTADALAEAGAHVILSGLDVDELAAAVDALRRAGRRADFAVLDVTDYNASKAGVHHLTRSLAGEWTGRGVQVNAVAPTYVNTLMSSETAKDPSYFDPWMQATPMRRMIEPEEVAAAVLFLAAPASSAMTGAVVSVDAGYTVW